VEVGYYRERVFRQHGNVEEAFLVSFGRFESSKGKDFSG
jgi:hypothetical protein